MLYEVITQQFAANFRLDVVGHDGVRLEKLAHVFLALADAIVAVAIPAAGLVNDAVLHAEIDDLAVARDALTVENLEFRLLERW